jgi:hypothetical protein
LFHGDGIFSYNNGDVYEGEFRNSKKNGYGVYSYFNGDEYKGIII